MTTEKSESDRQEEGWEEVPGVEIPVPPTVSDSKEQLHPYGPKSTDRPWRVSLYTALVGLVLALLIVALPEIREFRITNDSVFSTGYVLMPIPIMALIWAVICLAHSEHRSNWRPAVSAIVLAVLSAALLAYAIKAGAPTRNGSEITSESGRSLEMSEEELKTWRDEKLQR